jgi:hypothetical protein
MIANANYEVENGSGFLGKPYEPNAIFKNDVEFILMLRKPGAYRTTDRAAAARIPINQRGIPSLVSTGVDGQQNFDTRTPCALPRGIGL